MQRAAFFLRSQRAELAKPRLRARLGKESYCQAERLPNHGRQVVRRAKFRKLLSPNFIRFHPTA